MSQLDKAFIRAYQKLRHDDQPSARQPTSGAGIPRPHLHPATLDHSPSATVRQAEEDDNGETIAGLSPDEVLRRVDPAGGTSRLPHLRLVAPSTEQEEPLLDSARRHHRIDGAQPFGAHGAPNFAVAESHDLLTTEDLHDDSEIAADASSPILRATTLPPPPAVEAPHTPQSRAAQVAASAGREPLAPTGRAALLPAWQVDEFDWPAASLSIAACGALDNLCWELVRQARSGRKRWVVAAEHSRSGCTTLIMALGKRLSELGSKVVLADAHLDQHDAPHADLADSLGLAPSLAWQDHLSGQQPLAEALIELVGRDLTVLPATRNSQLLWDAVTRAAVDRSLTELAADHDLVLIDAPTPLNSGNGNGQVAEGVLALKPDAVLLLRDVRQTTMADIERASRQLRLAGLFTWGVMENFVSG